MVQKKRKTNFADAIDDAIQRNERSGATYGYLQLPKGISVYSPDAKGGKITLDIIPYEVTTEHHPEGANKGDLWWRLPYFVHRNVGASNDTVVCPSSIKQRCPICEHRAKRIKAQAPQEETRPLKPSERNLFVVVPLDDRKLKDQICVFDISKYLFTDLLLKEAKENPEYKNFADLEEGYSVKIRFESQTIGNSQPFAEASRIDFIERDQQYEESILDDVPHLDDMLIILSYEELQAKFFEMEQEEDAGTLRKPGKKDEDEDEPEEEAPTKKSGIARSTKKVERGVSRKPVKEEEPEDEPEEDEPEEKSTRKGGVTRKTVSRKDEPEEDEPEEKPTKKSPKTNTTGCPHGHVFGTDFEQFEECETCKKWDACADENEK